MIEVQHLSKKYGSTYAVHDVSFTVRPGMVTGFLGPNGAGKSTAMRSIIGLDRPTAGRVLVDGREYRDLMAPLTTIGALLDAKGVDKGRSARAHLRALGATIGVGRTRVDEVLDLVGLTDDAHRSAGDFSLGMSQRLGLASALIGDPGIVLLDEPANGLDPDGILWLRHLCKQLAAEGRTVFLSSHLMSEMELTADHLVVIGKGQIIADLPMRELIAGSALTRVSVVSPDVQRLAPLLRGPDVTVTRDRPGQISITGMPAAVIGDLAADNGLRLHELRTVSASLEEAYMELTHDAATHRGTALAGSPLVSTSTSASASEGTL